MVSLKSQNILGTFEENLREMKNHGDQNQHGQGKNREPPPRYFRDVYQNTYARDHNVRGIAADSYLISPSLITLVQNK